MSTADFSIKGNLQVKANGVSNFAGSINASGGFVGALSGNVIGNLTGNVTGNSSTASALKTAVTLSLSGDATASGSLDGSANLTLATTLAASGVAAAAYGSSSQVPHITVDSKGRITAAANTSIVFPVTSVAGRTGAITLTQADVSGTVASSLIGVASGIASLDSTGKVPSSQLPAVMTSPVTSVAGKTGVVVLTQADVSGTVAKSGDIMTGSLGLPRTAGSGITVEGTFGWADLIGSLTPRYSGSSAPNLDVLLTSGSSSIQQYAYQAADKCDCYFHVPHDYVPGTDLYIHLHWTHNGTSISGNLGITYSVSYAKGHQQASFSTIKNPQLLVTGLNITNTPSLFHRVDEIQLSTSGGSSTLLDTSAIEVDGLILVNLAVTSAPSISGSSYRNSPYLICADLHYQSTGMTTKNKSPSFYA